MNEEAQKITDHQGERDVRIARVHKLREMGVIPYAQSFDKKNDIIDIVTHKDDALKSAEELMENGAQQVYTTAGRLILWRTHGKLSFGKIRDNGGDLQLCFVRGTCKLNTGKEIVSNIMCDGTEMDAYKFMDKFIDMGDYVGVKGDLFLTKHGELTLFVDEFQLLSKAIRPLPEKFHGIQDQEDIYRKRYLDMIANEESYKRLLLRSNFIKTLRAFYDKHNFIEIETPVMGSAASGAAAKPFITHHNDFDTDFFLRISPETSLKKATVGRLERVFEIGKQFRNEGSDPSHLQEFTSVEHYAVYRNYEDNMKFTEEMFDYIFSALKIEKKINVKDKEGNIKEVDFTTPWARIDYAKGVQEASGIDISKYGMDDADLLRADIKSKKIEFEGMDKMGTTTLIDYLFKKVLRPSITGPAFVYNYPRIMQPLARVSDKDDNIVEQFQLITNGREILKAYSELVDPILQKANFDAQAQATAAGDQEATATDDDFVTAMEYGMPCQSGRGMGIERIIAILTEQDNLRDVVMFPLMKPEKVAEDIEEKEAEETEEKEVK